MRQERELDQRQEQELEQKREEELEQKHEEELEQRQEEELEKRQEEELELGINLNIHIRTGGHTLHQNQIVGYVLNRGQTKTNKTRV